ncbi:MAG TPA: myo-inosose-2 dehydratase [Terrimicrobiaceae bacterium]
MTASQSSEKPVRLGISPLSWTNDVLADLGGDVPLEVCLKDAQKIGFEGVEFGRKFPKDPRELSPKLSSYGLQLAGGWYSGYLAERSLEDEWAAVQDHVRLLEGCGCRALVYGECGKMPSLDLPLSQAPSLKSIDLPDYARKLTEFSARLKDRGLTLAYHYHLMMLVETAEEIAAFCETTDESVGILLDTGHAYAAGADYGEILRRFGKRVVHIHLKDVRRNVLDRVRKDDLSFNAGVREGMFTVPGDGCVNFSEIAKFVKTSDYRGWVVVEAEQDPAKATPEVYAQKAFRYIKDLMF